MVGDDFRVPMYRIARRVLSPVKQKCRNSWTQIDNLEALNNQYPVENLILFLGANDCLGTIRDRKIKDMEEEGLSNLETDC